jgi:hypothetical protein
MHKLLDANLLMVGLTSAVQFVLFLRWIYRRIRNDEITRAFVRDMATNHLPHIYERLEQLCERQGIAPSPMPPPIRYLDLNGKSGG